MVEERAARSAADAVDPDEVVAFARALIAAPSENPGGTEDDAAAVASRILADLGADVTVVRSDTGRPNVVGVIGAGSPRLAWNGHLDVVPAGAPDTWTYGPWDGIVSQGRLVGRGSADMKGGVAAALGAVAAMRRAGIAPNGTLVFHLAADEELMGIHGTKVLWERGLLDQDACIVGEPTELQIATAERGGAWFTVTAFGRASHGSQPHRGVNAITSMARLLLRLGEALPELRHPLVGPPTINAALIEGGTAPNVVPDRCTVEIDRRIIPGETDPEAVTDPFLELIARIREANPEVELSVELREWTDAAETSADSAVARLALQATAAERDAPSSIVGFSGITDARFYINQARIPTIILGPGSMTVAHTANEAVAVDELVSAARIYARMFAGFPGE